MKVIGCAIRKIGAAKCPTEIRFQDTHVSNCLLMWMSSKSGSQLLCVPCSLKYLMYLHTLQETFNQCWVSGPHHLDLLPLNALEKLVFIFLNRDSHLQMVLIALHLSGRTKLISMRKKKKSGGIDQVKLSLNQTQSKCKNYEFKKQVSIGQH